MSLFFIKKNIVWTIYDKGVITEMKTKIRDLANTDNCQKSVNWLTAGASVEKQEKII